MYRVDRKRRPKRRYKRDTKEIPEASQMKYKRNLWSKSKATTSMFPLLSNTPPAIVDP
jgi:hypothetical protein